MKGTIYAYYDPALDLTARITRSLLEHAERHPGQPPPTTCAVQRAWLKDSYTHPSGIRVISAHVLPCDVWLLEAE